MKYFAKLNVVSILYALMIFVPIQFMGNVYRISRLTGWDIGAVNALSFILNVVIFICGTIIQFFLTIKWLEGRRANVWTAILWVPYFILFVYLIVSLFPITYKGDDPNPVTGLIAMAALISFPFYILLIHSMGFISQKKN